MRVNSINSLNYNAAMPSFKHTAVPYPEYESAYYNNQSLFESKVNGLVDKISELFSAKVSKEASDIKSGIDNIYSINSEQDAKKATNKQLLSVLA